MSDSRQRRDDEKEQRREAIVDAAEAVFASHGFDASKMDDVARKARVSRALVYLYFGSKAELQFAVCLRALRLLRDELAAAAETTARGDAKIAAIGAAYMRYAERHPLYFATLSRFEAHRPETIAAGSSERAVLEAGAAVHDVTIAALRIGMRDGSIRRTSKPMLLAMTLWSFTHGAIQVAQTKSAFLEEVGLSSGDLLQHAIEMAMRGLRPAAVKRQRPG
ncbi:TetR/AcrR family transcriptional regulator [Solimonas terrae]|uniref:TetR/AcrR family transcriptional regulator n=1 Tax=Solimonas terrae TaxID=1396819 RepID=A0A6M2BT07_9GAMM|nr:TetR/AcrR family transcriptional regulator [Solimonas terrae]